MDLKEIALELAKKHGVAFAEELLTQIAFPLIEKVVKESATPIDDVILAALEPKLKEAIQAKFAELKA